MRTDLTEAELKEGAHKMPAGSTGTFWGRTLRRRVPPLFKRCPAGLLHPGWDQVCYCRLHEHIVDSTRPEVEWHGGIYDFRSKREILTSPIRQQCVLHLCPNCYPGQSSLRKAGEGQITEKGWEYLRKQDEKEGAQRGL